jgi:tRNA dimethylallyltransferase
MSRAPKVLAVVGPTAVGKTGLAEELAVRLGGEIVSADSMQVYKGMDIGTAKPSPAERRVPYHCLDLVDPGTPYSAAMYQGYARAAIEEIVARGTLPVVVGGTGLYVRAALDDMHFPEGQARSPERDRLEGIAAERGPEAVYALLVEADPASAALIHQNNTRRVIRALEMRTAEVSYAEQRAGFRSWRSVYDTTFLGLTMDRDALYARIDSRLDAMLEAGLLEEIAGLLREGYRDALTATQAIGYKEFVPVAEDRAHLDEALVVVRRATHRLAKRQLTWFRADPRVIWLDVTDLSREQAADAAFGLVESHIRSAT